MRFSLFVSAVALAAAGAAPYLWSGGPTYRHAGPSERANPPVAVGAKRASAQAAPDPVRLTVQGDNVKPFVAIRPAGGIYVAWARQAGEKATVLFARCTDGAHLAAETPVSLVGMHLDLGAESGPNVAVDAKGTIFVAFAAGSTAAPKMEHPAAASAAGAPRAHSGHPPRPGNLNIWLARSIDDGATFSLPVRVNDDVDGAEHRFPTVVPDGKGGVDVAWLDKRKKGPDGQEMARVFFARSVDGGRTFGANVDATVGQPYPICHCCRVGAACDANGGLSVAFRNDINDLRDMFLVRSADGGRTFSAPSALERTAWKLPTCPMDGPSIGFDASGTVHAAWMTGGNPPGLPATGQVRPADNKVLYTCVVPGGSTAAPTLLGVGHHPRVAVAHSGETYVVWHDRFVRLARVGAGDRPAAQILDLAASEGAASYPSLALASDGGVYCAWQQLQPDNSVQLFLSRVPERAFAPK